MYGAYYTARATFRSGCINRATRAGWLKRSWLCRPFFTTKTPRSTKFHHDAHDAYMRWSGATQRAARAGARRLALALRLSVRRWRKANFAVAPARDVTLGDERPVID